MAIVLFAGLAQADMIGPSCGTCQGSLYTLSYSGTPISHPDSTHSTYRITLTIDTTGYSGGGVDIAEVAIKAASSATAVLSSSPSSLGNWSVAAGGLSAADCSGSGAGFECADWIGSGAGVKVGGVLSWTFDYTVPNGTLATGLNGASIKVRYVDKSGNKVGSLVSEDITLGSGGTPVSTPVPEPASMILLGTGLIGLAKFVRRRTAA